MKQSGAGIVEALTAPMSNTLERLAVIYWRDAARNGTWVRVSMNFAGMFRLLLWHRDMESAELAEFLSDLARWRSKLKFEAF